mgnify:CR=1 FL=1
MKEGKDISTSSKTTAKSGNEGQDPSRYNNVVGILVFMAFLTIPYIYNSHLTDRKYRKSEKIKAEMIEMRSEFITLKSEIVGENKQSDVAKKLSHRGIQVLTESPIDLNSRHEH